MQQFIFFGRVTDMRAGRVGEGSTEAEPAVKPAMIERE